MKTAKENANMGSKASIPVAVSDAREKSMARSTPKPSFDKQAPKSSKQV
jgi:hypothetical protein